MDFRLSFFAGCSEKMRSMRSAATDLLLASHDRSDYYIPVCLLQILDGLILEEFGRSN